MLGGPWGYGLLNLGLAGDFPQSKKWLIFGLVEVLTADCRPAGGSHPHNPWPAANPPRRAATVHTTRGRTPHMATGRSRSPRTKPELSLLPPFIDKKRTFANVTVFGHR